ncbi:MAG: single-stranded DNA-binding protein [Campylobacter sp.]|nr:single-stranded DNA-binding protein [Campylobacter sp.]MBO7475560.1 single-stranded DNA-binding protein [Campylobacter sp.]
MFNKVVLVGNLTRDIELRYLQNGTAIGKCGIAVTRKYSGGNGERKEETCFIDIDFWGRTAEVANQYLHKGSKILVEGRLKYDQWQDQNGQNRSKHTITVENMEMLSAPNTQGGNYQNNQGGYNGNSTYGSNSQNSYGGNSYSNTNNHSANSYGNSNYGSNSQNSYGSYGSNQNSQAPKQSESYKPKDDYSENIPEVDVDADKYDGDETIPF